MPAATHLAGPIPHYTSAQATIGTVVVLVLVAVAAVVVLFAVRRQR